MKKVLSLLTLVLLATFTAAAQNITPQPSSLKTVSGTYTLPSAFTISVAGLPDSLKAEATKFAAEVNATGMAATLTESAEGAHVAMTVSASDMNAEGYNLGITTDGVTIESQTAAGFYYAFRTLKRLLPDSVRAGIVTTVSSVSLPCMTVKDRPRFTYRGFMLDVSRHFFTVEEVKRMIDLMAEYKMNKFHWHLTDDQGWRIEIKKYPKLTTVGATAPNSRFTSLEEAKAYWINKEYGPYFYTQEEMKDVVAYAAERHVDVIPEIDMPGHFAAAMTAYPEYSCTPNGSHSVQIDGGVYNDILNVANPDAVQFVKDILDELMQIFPSHNIHIGGDECPTSAWESNADCQKFYAEKGFTDYRQLQSWFIGEISDYVKAQGRQLSLWNEAITASNADTETVKATGAPIYCWYPADQSVTKASSLSLPSIYTIFGPYYINRRQGSSEQDPPGAGSGTDNVKATYNQAIPSATSLGIQGTFWCEWVSDKDYLEWLAIPRLMAIAEAGWTPQLNRNFDKFIARVAADTTVLKLKDYKYCNYLMPGVSSGTTGSDKVMPHANTDTKKYYYRLISGGSDATRKDRCIELLKEGSSLITTYSGKGAAANVLWTNTQAAAGADNYDYQWWSIEEDPDNAGYYALVCKAVPEGSVKPNPTVVSTSGRWQYDTAEKHYNFRLGTGAYGQIGDNYYYSIASNKTSGQYMNSSMSGQGLAVNLYTQPTDGGGGQWRFSPYENYDSASTKPVEILFDTLQTGKYYVFTNAVDGFEHTTLSDNGSGSSLTHSTDAFAANAWEVTAETVNKDGTQTVTLKNAATGKYIGTVGSYSDKLGYPVSTAGSGSEVTLSYVEDYADLRLMVSSKSLFPLPSGLVYAGSTISGASYDAARGQGAEWTVQEVRIVTFVCKDDQGNDLGTVKRSVPVSTTEITAALCPEFKNNSVKSMESAGDNIYNVTYQRSAYAVTILATDEHGAIISKDEVAAPVGQTYTVSIPAQKYYSLVSSTASDGSTFVPRKDSVITVVYTTDAITGVKALGETVTTLEDGKSYLFYDATTATGRAGYRMIRESDNQINRSTTIEDLTPAGVWTLEKSGAGYKVKNDYTDLYVPQLVRSTATTASATGAVFTFTLNSDGETWKIKSPNGQYWDGLADGSLVGWDGATLHPIRISTFYAQPMYTVIVNCVDSVGTVLKTTTALVNAGDAYTLSYPTIDGYKLKSVTGVEDYAGTVETYVAAKAVYEAVATAIEKVMGDKAADRRVYDLQGRRVAKPERGIYIIGGKKQIIK